MRVIVCVVVIYWLRLKLKPKSAALILHDVGTKESSENAVEDFKDGKRDKKRVKRT